MRQRSRDALGKQSTRTRPRVAREHGSTLSKAGQGAAVRNIHVSSRRRRVIRCPTVGVPVVRRWDLACGRAVGAGRLASQRGRWNAARTRIAPNARSRPTSGTSATSPSDACLVGLMLYERERETAGRRREFLQASSPAAMKLHLVGQSQGPGRAISSGFLRPRQHWRVRALAPIRAAARSSRPTGRRGWTCYCSHASDELG